MVDIWFADCEVFRYDDIWVFKNKRTKQIRTFHNNLDEVRNFIENNDSLWLCGYNFRDYDQYILKATLLGYTCEQIKELNDILIYGNVQDAWEYLGSDSWDVELPPIIDLFHDIVPRRSLKELEGFMGRPVVETSVSFDIDRPLTTEEVKKEIDYCISDVEATEDLYYRRMPYIKAKKDLCELANLDDAKMMINANARIAAEALHAEKIDPLHTFGIEHYDEIAPWHIVDKKKLPDEVREFAQNVNTLTGSDDNFDTLIFDLYGTPTTLGIGGIHASTGRIYDHVFKAGPRKGEIERKYESVPKQFVTDDEWVVLIQDIGSYYPTMMIEYGYLSRAIPREYAHLYKEFYDKRMRAKKLKAECEKKGDTNGVKMYGAIAEAAKLLLNTVYGCMKSRYNKLYDPFKAVCVCLSGQLFIIDLMNRMHDVIPEFEIVQLNTDGWVLKIPKSKQDDLQDLVKDWCALTHFTVDTDEIKQMWQRDVNNYVIEFATGKVKAKGGTVKNWRGGDFKSNSLTIIDTALVKKMIYDVPIEDTITECMDMEPFQIILKAGSSYECCGKVHQGNTIKEVEYIDGNIHRVYAVKPEYDKGGTFYKFQWRGSNPSKFSDSPECACEDFTINGIEELDKSWYIDLAYKKFNAFTGEKEKMSNGRFCEGQLALFA